MTALEVLKGAMERLLRLGWRRDEFGKPDGPSCALGAIHFVAGSRSGTLDSDGTDRTAAMAARCALADAIGGDGPDAFTVVTTYNDARGRRRAQIVRAFDRAIASLEASS